MSPLFAFIGMPEVYILLFVILLLFGSTKLPGLMRSLGQSVTEFKKGMDGTSSPEIGTASKPEAKKLDAEPPKS